MPQTPDQAPGTAGSRPADPPLLIFLHIPKAGGTTLGRVISRQFAPEECCEVSFDRLQTFERFFALSDQEKARIRCVKGHFPFGIHERFPTPARYVTMLRDPVKRFISEYRFLKDFPQVRTDLPVPESALVSFQAYLDHNLAINAVNWQVRQAGGYLPLGALTTPLEPLPADALETAIANLERHCAVTGILSRFDESLVLMKRRLGWRKRIFYLRENVNKSPRPADEIPAAELDRLVEHIALDRKLYAYAAERLERDLAAEGPDFARELRRFRQLSGTLTSLQRYYQRWVPGGLRRALRKIR